MLGIFRLIQAADIYIWVESFKYDFSLDRLISLWLYGLVLPEFTSNVATFNYPTAADH